MPSSEFDDLDPTQHWDIDGSPLSLWEWAEKMERKQNEDYGVVGRDQLVLDGVKVLVSTVWLGLDHNFGRYIGSSDARPWIFETMVFPQEDFGDPLVCLRYAIWEEAEVGHKMVVKLLKKGALRALRELEEHGV